LAAFGEKPGVMVIGPAGEKLLTGSSIQFADPAGRPARAAGRGGLGAIMGSKGVKAIIVDDRGTEAKQNLIDAEKFKEASQKWAKMLTCHPISGQALPAYGTAVLINIVNEAGARPRNFRRGCLNSPRH
jgi:aldehyde:ferredoxin oxidoreductase